MQITYIGPDLYRQIPAAGDVIVNQGETVEIDDTVAKSLLEQTDQWAKTPVRKGKE